jgi:hypothetical protein
MITDMITDMITVCLGVAWFCYYLRYPLFQKSVAAGMYVMWMWSVLLQRMFAIREDAMRDDDGKDEKHEK